MTAVPPSPSGAVTVAVFPSWVTCTTSVSSELQITSGCSVVFSGRKDTVRVLLSPVFITRLVLLRRIPSITTCPVWLLTAACMGCGRMAEMTRNSVSSHASLFVVFFCLPVIWFSSQSVLKLLSSFPNQLAASIVQIFWMFISRSAYLIKQKHLSYQRHRRH